MKEAPKREYTIYLERFEMLWLMRHVKGQVKGAENAVTMYRPMAEDAEAQKRLKQAQDTVDILTPLDRWCDAEFNRVERERLKHDDRLQELAEAYTLIEEEDARQAAKAEYDRTSVNGPCQYSVKLDRVIIKFILKILELDLDLLRTKILNEKKKDPEEYTDPIFKKSYYVNKMIRDKEVLERLTEALKRLL